MANHLISAPAWLNGEYMENILKNYFKEPNLKVQKTEVVPGSAEGDNYVCQILRIKLEVDINGDQKKMSFIGKIKPDTRVSEILDSEVDVFALEAFVFEKILPGIKEQLKDTKNFAPECIHVDNDKKLILLEDLARKGFVLLPREEFLDKQQTLLAVKAFAKLHGASYKLVENDPSLKEKFQYGLLGDKPDPFMDRWMENAFVYLKKNVGSYGMSEDWQRRLLAVAEKLTKGGLGVCNLRKDRLNVLCHGDAWKNNMLYHFTDGVSDGVILIDFQIMTYNSFATDLQFFLFTNVEANVLVHDLDHILETYFNTLQEVAPDIPNLSLDMIKKEFADLYFLGCAGVATFRSFISSKDPPDLEKLLNGKEVDAGFGDPRFIADLHKLLPLMAAAGVF